MSKSPPLNKHIMDKNFRRSRIANSKNSLRLAGSLSSTTPSIPSKYTKIIRNDSLPAHNRSTISKASLSDKRSTITSPRASAPFGSVEKRFSSQKDYKALFNRDPGPGSYNVLVAPSEETRSQTESYALS